MLYVLFCEDRSDSQSLRLETRDAHLAYVAQHADLVRMAGPMLTDDGSGMVGSLFILEADSAEAVRTFHEDDPYTRAGLWGNVALRPFRQVVPKP